MGNRVDPKDKNNSRGSLVTIDENRILHVNGQPFFPVGARHMPIGADPALLKETGFNCMRWTAFGTDTALVSAVELPDELGGLMFYPYIYNYGDLSDEVDKKRTALAELINRVKDHPALLCYEQRNEPACTYREPSKPQSPPDGMITGSDLIRSLDPNHPIRVGHLTCNLVSTLRDYNPAVDIVGCNPYMVFAPGMRPFVGTRPDGKLADCPDQTLSAVGKYTTKMMRVAEGRPVWMQVQACANENWFNPAHTPETRDHGLYEHHRLYPNRWQMRFMAFNAIIRGATALEWAMIKLPVDSGAWIDVSRVIGELRSLHDVLASPPWGGVIAIEYSELGFSDWDGVETLVKIYRGKPWILAANTQFDPMIATFSNLPDGLGDKVNVVGEDRQVAVGNGAFTDRFQPYEVHVYGPVE